MSGLILSNKFPENWPGNDLNTFNMWLPELFGGLVGIATAVYCRTLLLKAKESAQRAEKSDSTHANQRLHYIPWCGANNSSRAFLLWLAVVPGFFVSFTLFGVSATSFATSIGVVKQLDSVEDPNYGHAVGVVALCLHLLMIFCKLFVLSLGIVIPVVILIVAKCRNWVFLSKRVYPFAVYLDVGRRDARPLLIEL